MSHSVTLDGKSCVLKYGPDERETIEALFPRDGMPGSMGELVRLNLLNPGSLRVQTALVWVGVRHLGKTWTNERVRGALVKAMQNGGVSEILTPTLDEILASGVLGKVVEAEAEPEPDADPKVAERSEGSGSSA